MPVTKQVPIRNISKCGQCGEEFNGMAELKNHIKEVHIKGRLIEYDKPVPKEEPSEAPSQEPQKQVPSITPAPKPKPIILEYKFKGQCPDCRHDVRTIMINVGTESFATAYCANCDKSLSQEKVTPLKKNGHQKS